MGSSTLDTGGTGGLWWEQSSRGYFFSQTPESKNQWFLTCKQPVDQFTQAVSRARLIVLSTRNGTALHQRRASICPPVAKPRVVSEGDVGNAPSSFFVCSSLCPSGYLHAACVPIPYRLCVYCHVCLSVSLLPACSPHICLTVPTMHRKSWFHIEMLQLIRQKLRMLGKRVKPVKPGVKPVQKRVKPVKPVILKKNNITLFL